MDDLVLKIQIAEFAVQTSIKRASECFDITRNMVRVLLEKRQFMKDLLELARMKDAELNRRIKGVLCRPNEKKLLASKKPLRESHGPKRDPVYVALDDYFDAWLTEARDNQNFQVTPKILIYMAMVRNQNLGLGLDQGQILYWYRTFKGLCRWSLRRVTTTRRKRYAEGEKDKQILRFGKFLRELKLRYQYPSARILNFDEVPCWFDMPAKCTLDHTNAGSISINTCNAEKKRYTVGLTVSASGEKLPIQVLFRRKTVPPELDTRPEDGMDVWVAEKGNTTDKTMADLVVSILVPYLQRHGGGPGGDPSLFIVDGAGSHKGELFKKACRANNIHLAIIPSSCTDLIQLIDVRVGAPFKDHLYFLWAKWMLEHDHKYQTKSNNRVAADFLTALGWVQKAFDAVKPETILSGVEQCYMNETPGEAIEVEDDPEPPKPAADGTGNGKEIVVVKSRTPERLQMIAEKKEKEEAKIRKREAAKRKKEAARKRKEAAKQKRQEAKKKKEAAKAAAAAKRAAKKVAAVRKKAGKARKSSSGARKRKQVSKSKPRKKARRK